MSKFKYQNKNIKTEVRKELPEKSLEARMILLNNIAEIWDLKISLKIHTI